MITIIAGTNRLGSYTRKVAKEYERILQEKGLNSAFLSLEDVHSVKRDANFESIEQKYLLRAKFFIFVLPEYNGSFPGFFKLFIDNTKPNEAWLGKKALLVGNSTGRAGNLRGLDQITGILNHMKMTVHPNKLPISVINKLMDENGKFVDENTLAAINTQLDEFIKWV
ncbi:MAG: NAD(P)H-dependent oxidoreductase [Chitinophagaceae bacterium]|nr:NAD(P)H-dependent oxidoreductase [Chitinophagaceae bacterium]